MKSLNVMVVDDSLITIKKLSQMLEILGHKVVATAKNGQQAIEEYQNCKPDLVTMDITMPEMDGIEATKGILKIDKNALIIMVTSHGQEQMVINAIESGAKGYVLKPFKEDKLQETIERAYSRFGGN